MKKIGMALMLIGLTVVTFNGYEWLKGFRSIAPFNGFARAFDDRQGDQQYEKGEAVARLTIPRLERTFTVFWGTDEDTLEKGVGMYVSQWTAPPGHGAHTVLAGHRDTVFTGLGELTEGDILYVAYNGRDYEYEIDKIWVTDADDRSVIVEKKEPTLTLTTCYPFDYIGDAPKRYIVQAKLVRKGDLLKDP
ncbi:MAG TPA: class D sortase [Bacillales bacterium]|nr:class D sortase [Bacillales bacterium]